MYMYNMCMRLRPHNIQPQAPDYSTGNHLIIKRNISPVHTTNPISIYYILLTDKIMDNIHRRDLNR